MSTEARKRLDLFWQLLDEILNGVLFVLSGLELLDRLAALVPPLRVHRHRHFGAGSNGRSWTISAATADGRSWPPA